MAWLDAAQRAALDAAWQQARQQGRGFQVLITVAWPGQSPHRHLCRAAPIREGEGPIMEWAGVLLDLDCPPEMADSAPGDAEKVGGQDSQAAIPPA